MGYSGMPGSNLSVSVRHLMPEYHHVIEHNLFSLVGGSASKCIQASKTVMFEFPQNHSDDSITLPV